MNLPFSLRVALRYIVAKQGERFVSLLAWIAIGGIFLGVTALIVVLSVMDGFDEALRDKLLAFTPQVIVQNQNSSYLEDWEDLQVKLKNLPAVKASTPIVNAETLARDHNSASYLKITGIIPQQVDQIFPLGSKMVEGSLEDLAQTKFGIIVNIVMANNMGIGIGDQIKLISPNLQFSIIGLSIRSKDFKVVGIFDTKYKSDAELAFVNLEDAQKFFQLNNKVSALAFKLDDLFAAQGVAEQIEKILGKDYHAKTWMELNAEFFSALALEKTIMFIILLLIVAVATFNILSILIMTVTDKYREVAILRTVGATRRQIMWVFVTQGAILGVLGILLGLVCGVLIADNVSTIDKLLQQVFHVKLFAKQAFIVNYLPSKISWPDILKIISAALLLNLLATIYPAWRATKINPIEALHYEK